MNSQLEAWRGPFGDAYTDRNFSVSPAAIEARAAIWRPILAHTSDRAPQSILEVGANIGANLMALRTITNARLLAAEPNEHARAQLIEARVADEVRPDHAGALTYPDGAADLVFTRAVLIHIHPDDLLAACRDIHRCARHWIACMEFFSDQPTSIHYRGHDDLLFKRDFGLFWMENFSELSYVAHGFCWRPVDQLDNMNWWLFRRRQPK